MISIIDGSIIDLGKPATQEDLTQFRNTVLKREISLSKAVGFSLVVQGQRTTDYMLERGQTSLESMHEISLKLSKLTMAKSKTVYATGMIPAGKVSTETLKKYLRSGNEPIKILEQDMHLFTLRNPATLKLVLQYKAGEHDVTMSAFRLKKEANAYVCQPDFTLAPYLLIAPVLGKNDNLIHCTIESKIDISLLEKILNEHYFSEVGEDEDE